MKKCVKEIRTSKYIIGLNGSTTYIYDLEENLIKTLKDIKSVYNAYVSKDEKVLCLKSTDTYLAFYDLITLELINKISFKNCHQPQDQESVFAENGNFINLQYTDRLTTDFVVYSNKDFIDTERYSYNTGVVLESIDIINDEIFIVGFVRPNKENFSLDEIKRYLFKFDEGKLTGLAITNKDYFIYTKLRKGLYSVNNAKDVEYMMAHYDFSKEELGKADSSNLKLLWDKYKNKEMVLTENPINL